MESPNSQRKTAVAQVVLESLSHNGKPPLSGFELGRSRPPPVPDVKPEQPGDALRTDRCGETDSKRGSSNLRCDWKGGPLNSKGILKGIRGIRIKKWNSNRNVLS